MYDILLTSLILLFLLFAALWQSRSGDEKNFFSKDYTNTLKGLCAIVVLLVHVDPSYQNPLQDGVGSFAYVAVTLFFFISAYGMQLSVERKPGYLKHFWRNRLVSLLIPCFLINLFAFAYQMGILNNKSLAVLVEINGYVKVLLQYCLLFYCVMMLGKWLKVEKTWITDGLLIAGVAGSSLYLYFSEGGDGANVSGWCYERYGLVWGLLLYRFFPRALNWFNAQRLVKIIAFSFLSALLGILYLKFKTDWFYGEYLLKVLLGISIITLLFLVSQKRIFGNRVGRFLGDISFEIYLSHGLIMGILAYFCPSLRSGTFLILSVVMTVLFSWLVHEIAKRLVSLLRAKEIGRKA